MPVRISQLFFFWYASCAKSVLEKAKRFFLVLGM